MVIFRSLIPDIEIPKIGIYQYVTSNRRGISDDKPVFIDGLSSRKVTFGELKRDTKRYWFYQDFYDDDDDRFAAGLQEKLNFKRGGIVSPANPLYTLKELTFQLNDSRASFLIVDPSLLNLAIKAAEAANIPKSRIIVFGDKEVNGYKPHINLLGTNEAEPVKFKPEELDTTAYLCYSSGTTGIPKGIETTHRNIVANVEQKLAFEGDNDDSGTVYIGVMPLFHIFGLSISLHYTLTLGATLVVLPRFDPVLFCKSIQDYKITIAHIAPSMAVFLVKDPTPKKYDLSSLKSLGCGGAPLRAGLADEFSKLYGLPIKQGYGLTEASSLTHIVPRNKIVQGSIGQLLPNIEAKIVSEEGKELGYNKPGELWIRGPNVMKGYLNNKAATENSIDKDGFFHTGDVAIIVAPAEIEGILLTHPNYVADAAVIGIWSEEESTEIPLAYIVTPQGVAQTEELKQKIIRFLDDQVAPYKKLRGGIIFVDTIPKSAAGKILRRMLRERAKIDYKPKSKL
ncbi:hypothetical protein G9A89_015500 [Geosiphon pyriformis]|nr:hypothetical protein G9A89_015500 [Geosiphon pyriformis]